jgi:uroporphyrin-3 C-methyltransferase
MSEIDNPDPPIALPAPAAAAAPPPDSPPPARARNGGAFGWLLLLVAIAAAAYLYWRLQAIEQGHDESAQSEQSQAQHLREQVEVLQRGVDATRHESETLRARLDDAAKVNESLRGQVLGLSERARLAEDAIANLAEKRLSGHDALLLNEAELLLVLGSERYALFNDPAPALAAYRLADAALGEANDAAFSTVRQSITAEMEALSALQTLNIPAAQAQLAQLRESLAQLPATAARGERATPTSSSRWWQVFGELVRVRRDTDTQALLAHNDPLLARALVDTALRDAQAALVARDQVHLRSALTTARARLAADFDTQTTAVSNALAALDDLAKLALATPAPQILGSALKELRNLRATHALRPESTPPKAVPTPVEGQS